jgi:hypothetical protein
MMQLPLITMRSTVIPDNDDTDPGEQTDDDPG